MSGQSTGDMSWDDVWELRRSRQRMRRPPPLPREEEGGYSYGEVMDEIRLIVADAARFLAEDPTRGTVALGTAEFLAHVRDDGRLRAQREVPLGDVASGFAQWLIRRADRGDLAAAAQAAWLAVNDSPEQAALGQELRDYVRADLDGSPSQEEDAPTAGDSLALAAASALAAIVADVSGPGAAPDALAAWEAFRRFAGSPFSPAAPERLEEGGGDMLFCEWGIYEWPLSEHSPRESPQAFQFDLVRQFSIVGEDGEYDRMLQVHCTMSFEPRPELRRLGSDSIWSATDRRRHWFEEVEQSDGFAALQTTTLLDMSIDGERL